MPKEEQPSTIAWKRRDDQIVTIKDIQSNLPHLMRDQRLEDIPDEHLLFFWTSCAKFAITGLKEHKSGDQLAMTANIEDSEGKIVGSVNVAYKEEYSRISSAGGDFIVLGRKEFQEPELRQLYETTLMAMQIECVDGIAYRRNMAEIKEAAWCAANPEWRLVCLM